MSYSITVSFMSIADVFVLPSFWLCPGCVLVVFLVVSWLCASELRLAFTTLGFTLYYAILLYTGCGGVRVFCLAMSLFPSPGHKT